VERPSSHGHEGELEWPVQGLFTAHAKRLGAEHRGPTAERRPETYRDVVVRNDVAEDYERTVGQIADALLALERARMAVEVDVLATALARDLIDADDFVPR
jgi:hypothetical protein